MSRIARIYIKTNSLSYYHLISHLQDELPMLKPSEKEKLLSLLQKLSLSFFVKILAYAIMGNHFHLLVKLQPPPDNLPDEEILRKALLLFRPSTVTSHSPAWWRQRLTDISTFMKELNQRFSQWYNLRYGRKGHFFRDRFRSIRIQDQRASLAVSLYIDLNPVRAGLSSTIDGYRWSSYSSRKAGMGSWLAPLKEELGFSLRDYSEALQEMGKIEKEGKGKVKEGQRPFLLHAFTYRAEGVVYGAEEFVRRFLTRFSFRRRYKFVYQGMVLA